MTLCKMQLQILLIQQMRVFFHSEKRLISGRLSAEGQKKLPFRDMMKVAGNPF